MLKLTLLELLLRGFPEGFLLVFAVHVFSKTAINIKRYIAASISFIIAVYLIRLLPIQYGVHTILNIIMIIILTVNINKIGIIKSIQTSILTMLIEFICEGINMIMIKYIFKVDIEYILSEISLKILYNIPSLLFFAAIVFTYYCYVIRSEKLNHHLPCCNINNFRSRFKLPPK